MHTRREPDRRARRNSIHAGAERHAAPDRSAALGQYRARAAVYDFEIASVEPMRRRAIERLGLNAGEAVIDAGCGTGLSLIALARAVGERGAVIGVEQSPEMIGRARDRIAAAELHNVTLVNAPGEEAEFPRTADALLFHFTHDLMQIEAAVERMMAAVRPGGRVVATGLKWAPWWMPATNLFVRVAALRSVTTLAGLDHPWRNLAPHLTGMVVEAGYGGGTYLAYGTRK